MIDIKFSHCVVPEKNPCLPRGRSLEIPRGEGVLKAKFLEAMYDFKSTRISWGEWGVQSKKPSMEGVWIFSETAHCQVN